MNNVASRLCRPVTALFMAALPLVWPCEQARADNESLVPTGTTAGKPGDSQNKDKQKPERNPAEGGEPVALHSGEYAISATDVHIPARGLPITIRRTYRSLSVYNSRFGFGWDMNVNMKVRELANGDAMLLDGNNRKLTYTLDGGGFKSPEGRYDTLTRNPNGTFTLTDKHGVRNEFDTNGNLTAIMDRNGNTLTFTYDTGGTNGLFPINGPSNYFLVSQSRGLVAMEYKLVRITDATGRQVNFSYNADGLLTSITDFVGRIWTYTYDAVTNDLIAVTAPATTAFPGGTTTRYAYANHRMTWVTDAKNQTYLINQYDDQGRVSSQVYAGGVFQFAYDLANKRTTVTDPRNVQTQTKYNDKGNPTEVVVPTKGWRAGDPPSFTTSYGYNSASERTEITYPRGNREVMDYDLARGNLLSRKRIAAPVSAEPDTVTSYTYDPTFNFVKTVTDPRGNTTTFDYDARGNLTRITQPPPTAGAPSPVWQFTYNAYGQVETVTDPEGMVTKNEYFSATGYLQRVTRNHGAAPAQVTEYTYDAVGNVTGIKDASGHTTALAYDAQNHLVQKTSPLGYLTKYGYDQNGNLTKVERQADDDPDGWQTTTYAYTVRDELQTVTDDMGHVTRYTYDGNGNRTSTVDAENHTTTYAYDERNLLWKITDARSPAGVTEYGYDLNDNLATLKDARGNTTNFDYDGFERLKTTTYPAATLGATRTTEVRAYDPAGNLTQFTNRRGQVITFGYDAINRRTAKTTPDPRSITYTYDRVGRVKTVADEQGTIRHAFDALGRLRQVTYPDGKTVGYEYDPVGNRRRLIYPDGFAVTYLYDAMDRLTEIRDTSSGGTVDFDGDADVDLADFQTFQACFNGPNRSPAGPDCGSSDSDADGDVDLTDFLAFQAAFNGPNRPPAQATGSAIVRYTYDSLSRRKAADYANGTGATYVYDQTGRLLTLTNEVAPTNLVYEYTYDKVGNRLTMTVNGQPHAYTYDATYQLKSVDYPDGFFRPDTQYNYDAVGNRTTVVEGGVTTAYATNNLNQYTSVGGVPYTYDDNGNLTNDGRNTYTYDCENHLISATTPTAAFQYDSLGRRTSRTVNGTATRFLYDGYRAIADHDDTGRLVRRFVHGRGLDEPVRTDRVTAPSGPALASFFYHVDGLGSVIGLTASTTGQFTERHDYDAYGAVSQVSVVENPYLFTSRECDDPALPYYYRARYYLAAIGRFSQTDPLYYWGGPNLYAYARNNPCTWRDPLGLRIDRPPGYEHYYDNAYVHGIHGDMCDATKKAAAAGREYDLIVAPYGKEGGVLEAGLAHVLGSGPAVEAFEPYQNSYIGHVDCFSGGCPAFLAASEEYNIGYGGMTSYGSTTGPGGGTILGGDISHDPRGRPPLIDFVVGLTPRVVSTGGGGRGNEDEEHKVFGIKFKVEW